MQKTKKKLLTLWTLSALMITSCLSNSPVSPSNTPNDSKEIAKILAESKFSIIGKVEFPNFRIKATQADVGPSATVSLIDPATNVTIGSTLTNATGTFLLSDSALRAANPSFAPVLNKVYILEAMKRIGGPGNDAMTLRTNLKYTGSGTWSSITMTPGFVGLSTKTTAISIISSLTPTVLSADATINSLPVDASGIHVPQDINATITAAVINGVKANVELILQNDKDPVAYIKFNSTSGKYELVNPTPIPIPTPTNSGGIPGCVGEGCSTSAFGSNFFFAAPYITTAGSSGTWGELLKVSVAITNNTTARFTLIKLPSTRALTNTSCSNNTYFEEPSTAVTLRVGSDTGTAVPVTTSEAFNSANPVSVTGTANPFNVSGCTSTTQNNTVVFDVNLSNPSDIWPKSFYITTSNTKGTAWFGPIQIIKNTHADDLITFHSSRTGSYDIYTMNVDGTNVLNLTNSTNWDANPSFSFDKSKIVFTHDSGSGSDIYIMNRDSSGQTQLTNSTISEYAPRMSRDGSKIAYNYVYSSTDKDIKIMNADGTGQTTIIGSTADERDVSFSPDGRKIVYNNVTEGKLYTAGVDGTGRTLLTVGSCADWSPNSDKIVFATSSDIHTINSDGTNLTKITNMSPTSTQACPSWSRDGSKIMFSSGLATSGAGSILIMNADGTNIQKLTTGASDREPAMKVGM